MKKKMLGLLLALGVMIALGCVTGAAAYTTVKAPFNTGTNYSGRVEPPIPPAAEGWYQISAAVTVWNPYSGHWEAFSQTDTTYRYNADGLPVRAVVQTQDGTTDQMTYTYDKNGNLTKAVSADRSYQEQYRYDENGPVSLTVTISENGDQQRYDFTYSPTEEAYLPGNWTFEYDAQGLLTHRYSEQSDWTCAYELDAQGRVASARIVDDGVTFTRTYSYANQKGRIHHARKLGAELSV